MWFYIDARSGLPIYRQIIEQVKRARAAGTIQPGDRLPSVRELSEKMLVNPNTVARAYRDLERDGVIETRRGVGTFVCEGNPGLNTEQRLDILAEMTDRLIAEARNLGIPPPVLTGLLQERLAHWHRIHPVTRGDEGGRKDD